jgi:hypothetical protein
VNQKNDGIDEKIQRNSFTMGMGNLKKTDEDL